MKDRCEIFVNRREVRRGWKMIAAERLTFQTHLALWAVGIKAIRLAFDLHDRNCSTRIGLLIDQSERPGINQFDL